MDIIARWLMLTSLVKSSVYNEASLHCQRSVKIALTWPMEIWQPCLSTSQVCGLDLSFNLGWPQISWYQSQQLTSSMGLHTNYQLFYPIFRSVEFHWISQYSVNVVCGARHENIWDILISVIYEADTEHFYCQKRNRSTAEKSLIEALVISTMCPLF